MLRCWCEKGYQGVRTLLIKAFEGFAKKEKVGF